MNLPSNQTETFVQRKDTSIKKCSCKAKCTSPQSGAITGEQHGKSRDRAAQLPGNGMERVQKQGQKFRTFALTGEGHGILSKLGRGPRNPDCRERLREYSRIFAKREPGNGME